MSEHEKNVKSQLDLCRMCLASDVLLFSIANTRMQAVYEKITRTPLVNGNNRPVVVCYICHAQLQKCQKLMLLVSQSENLLLHTMGQSNEVTMKMEETYGHRANNLRPALKTTPVKYFDSSIFNGSILVKDVFEHEYLPKPEVKEEQSQSLAECMICSAVDMRTYNIAGTPLQLIYENITKNLLTSTDKRPLSACYICCSQLNKCRKLMMRSKKTETILTALIDKYSKVSTKLVDLIDLPSHNLGLPLTIRPAECCDSSDGQQLVFVEKPALKIEVKIEIEPDVYVEMANRPTQNQMVALVEFLERNPGIARGLLRTQQAKQETRKKWQEFAESTNALGGIIKDGQGWAKYWAEKKSVLKKICQQRAQAMRRTGGAVDVVPELSLLKQRLVAVMGGDSFATGTRGIAQDPFPQSNSSPSILPSTNDAAVPILQLPSTSAAALPIPQLPSTSAAGVPEALEQNFPMEAELQVEHDEKPGEKNTAPPSGSRRAPRLARQNRQKRRVSFVGSQVRRFEEIELRRVKAEMLHAKALAQLAAAVSDSGARVAAALSDVAAAIRDVGEKLSERRT
nr:unnamed protein product [Amyelois transitella]